MTNNTSNKKSFAAGLKESCRKLLVGLKRKPQTIALLVLVIAFLYYSLNLTNISNTTAKIQGVGMGLCGFATMLFSILSLVCFGNAFPHRKKVNIPMLVLMFLMIAVLFYCDIYYMGRISNALYRAENPIQINAGTLYIAYAYNMLSTHMTILGIGTALVVTLPLYSKLIKRINTSIEVEDNGGMAEIDISGE